MVHWGINLKLLAILGYKNGGILRKFQKFHRFQKLQTSKQIEIFKRKFAYFFALFFYIQISLSFFEEAKKVTKRKRGDIM